MNQKGRLTGILNENNSENETNNFKNSKKNVHLYHPTFVVPLARISIEYI